LQLGKSFFCGSIFSILEQHCNVSFSQLQCDISANLMGLVKPKDRDQFYWLLTTPGLYMTRPTDGVTYLNCLADAIVATGNKGALRGLLWRVVATKNEQLVEKLMDHGVGQKRGGAW
jgi:hypothetical protein